MPLTNIACQKAQPDQKPYKMFDSGGLYLEVMPNGSKYWRLKYRYFGKENRLAIGVYPRISLAEARERREQAKKALDNNINPSVSKKEQKIYPRDRGHRGSGCAVHLQVIGTPVGRNHKVGFEARCERLDQYMRLLAIA